jgi:hypothetical protein
MERRIDVVAMRYNGSRIHRDADTASDTMREVSSVQPGNQATLVSGGIADTLADAAPPRSVVLRCGFALIAADISAQPTDAA